MFAAVHAEAVAERQMLVEALDRLGPDDVLILDRGYPSAWLAALLQQRGIRFCMRCDRSRGGWVGVEAFIASGALEQEMSLSAPKPADVRDYGCGAGRVQVRLVRVCTPDGQVRVMATNLPQQQFAAALFGELYHQRWRVEETFKRLKHQLNLESVTGLTQQAVLVDVHARVLADSLATLVCLAAHEEARGGDEGHVLNRAYAARALQLVLPTVVMGLAKDDLLGKVLKALAANVHRRRTGRSAPRPKHHVKPHPHMAYRHC